MKILYFQHAGEWYKVNEQGFITQERNSDFSGKWIFLGVSFHHWTNHINLKFDDLKNPKDLIKGYVWDLDHGSTRRWMGRYCGHLSRIQSAYFKEEG